MTNFEGARSDEMPEGHHSATGAAGRKRWQSPMVILSDVRSDTTLKGFGPEFFQPGFESS